MKIIKYYASASFDIETEVAVKDNASEDEIREAIVNDLEARYNLTILYNKDGPNA